VYVRLLYTAQCTWPFVGCAFDTEPSARDHLLDRSEVDLGVEHMFCFTLGHGLLNACIAEARRILRPWGVLFIYDLTTEDTEYVIPRIGYKPHPPHEVLHAAMRHGFKATSVIEDPRPTAPPISPPCSGRLHWQLTVLIGLGLSSSVLNHPGTPSDAASDPTHPMPSWIGWPSVSWLAYGAARRMRESPHEGGCTEAR
jgi:hypothetical protein